MTTSLQRSRLLLARWGLALCLPAADVWGATTVGAGDPIAVAGEVAPEQRDAEAPAKRCDLLVVAGQPGWLVATASPVAATLGGPDHRPLFVVQPEAVEAPVVRPVSKLANGARMTLGPVDDPLLLDALERIGSEPVGVDRDPTEATLGLAVRLWPSATHVVLAAPDDPRAAILGSVLA